MKAKSEAPHPKKRLLQVCGINHYRQAISNALGYFVGVIQVSRKPTDKQMEEAEKKILEAMGEGSVRFVNDEELTRRIRRALKTLPIDHPMRQKGEEFLEAKKENLAAKEQEEKKEEDF